MDEVQFRTPGARTIVIHNGGSFRDSRTPIVNGLAGSATKYRNFPANAVGMYKVGMLPKALSMANCRFTFWPPRAADEGLSFLIGPENRCRTDST